MFVSVIVCTSDVDNYQNPLEAVNSLLNQTYPELEIIIVVDNVDNQQLYKRIATAYATQGNIQIITSGESSGVSAARNTGIKKAQGDIIAFLDDDAVADKRWIERLVDTYQKTDAIAVAGKVLPIWLSNKPDYLPEELYWLVGLTYKGFAREDVTEVRNALGSNMSYRREVFTEVGLFNEHLGFARKHNAYLQGEEAELALRMKGKLGKGVIYDPDLIVYHKVPTWKTRLGMLLRRAFYQGYSKAWLNRLNPYPRALSIEESYLKDLFFKYIPHKIKKVLLNSNPTTEIRQLPVLLASILAVGVGFTCGHFQRKQLRNLKKSK